MHSRVEAVAFMSARNRLAEQSSQPLAPALLFVNSGQTIQAPSVGEKTVPAGQPQPPPASCTRPGMHTHAEIEDAAAALVVLWRGHFLQAACDKRCVDASSGSE
eukprot:1755982-Prymnesium_polylepis.3